MRWTDILGHDVVDTSTAEPAGTIDGLVVDPEASSIVAIVVGGQAVSWSDAGGIGTDALTLRGADVLHAPASVLEARAVDGAGDPLGKRVITEDGVEIGSVRDIEVDPQSGAIGRLDLGEDDIKGSRLLGIGAFAVMVSAPGRRSTRPASTQGGAGSGGGDDLDGLTKAELYEIAQDQDLAGRSAMSKQELLDALS